jgi:hypothetical protein
MHHTLYTAVATREIYWIICELYRLLVFVSEGCMSLAVHCGCGAENLLILGDDVLKSTRNRDA